MSGLVRELFGPGAWGVGGNLVAAAILGALGAIAAYFTRHKITARLAALWDRHHGPKVVERQKQALREHEAEKQQREDGRQ